MATADKLVKYISKISRKTYKKNTELKSSETSISVILNEKAYKSEIKDTLKNNVKITIIEKKNLISLNLFVIIIFNNNEKT